MTSLAHAAEGDYAFSKIPAGLLKNASAVKRAEEMTFEITPANKAIYRHRIAFTILNEQGDNWAYFSEWYDKLRSIEVFEGTLFDAGGKKIKSLKRSDIKDVSGTDEISLADDNRVKWHSFFYKNYPYTVEYEVEVRYKGTMFIPDWTPMQKSMMAVQQSRLTMITPAANPLRYKMFNYAGEPVITEDKGNKTYSWEVKDMPAVMSEYASPSWREITTSVMLASEHFVIGDYEGSNASWKDFGKFEFDMKKGRDALPDDLKQKVHQLTDHLNDPKEKVRVLYEFMQQNSRYVSIQLGIGGWQPFDAKYVAARKYGDCKALSNFMYALLKEAGIRSVYTLISGDVPRDYLLVDFPRSQFNHVILFVPDGQDTIWLECTSQTKPAGYLGGPTANRYALAVEENGGTIVRTPVYSVKENMQVRKIKATLDNEATLKVNMAATYQAMQQDVLRSLINELSKDKLKDRLQEELDLGTYDIDRFDYREEKKILPVIHESLDITVSNYATITGKRLFITPNIMTRSYRKLSQDTARKYDLQLESEYTDIDTTEIELPKGYEAEAMPQDVTMSTPFGKYHCSVKLKGNKLWYYRHIEMYGGRFPANQYNELVKFYEMVYKADRNKVVLLKNDTLKAF
ncbi:MAG: DUF3857 and transglutaminase domain-containing protein [Chitinophagaceae bacterium]|nr:DUF3857 and transglutaminase domain-containing protein [Chitinophagaceae bacterium]